MRRTIGPRKDQTLLAEAFARVAKQFSDWKLVFIGRANDEAMMRRIREIITRQKLDGQIQFLGWRSDDELRDWMQRAAIFAMPSVYEGLGLSLQEGPILRLRLRGHALRRRCRFDRGRRQWIFVPVGQPAPLAVALERLMRDEKLRGHFSRRSPQSVLEKEMTAEHMVRKYETLYAGIIAQKRILFVYSRD